MSGVNGSLHGFNLYAYCFNNPISYTDSQGNWPTKEELQQLAGEVWGRIVDGAEAVAEAVTNFVNDIAEDFENYDPNNTSEQTVLDSNYFSVYKGVFVIRTNGDRSGSFGVIFLTRESNYRDCPEDVVRHEYGHTKQLEQLGVLNYALCIGLPSWQEWGTGSYYCKPWEVTADIYGGVQSRTHSQEEVLTGLSYLNRSKRIGPLAWLYIN